jgi:hypothetical protein
VASLAFAIRRRVWERVVPAALLRAGGPFIGLAGAVSALFAINHRDVFRAGHLSTGALGITADVPQYVLWADHIREASRAGAGRTGLPIGALVADTTAGAFIALAEGAAWSGTPTWQATLPLALVMAFMTACAARDLASVMIAHRRVVVTLIGLAAVTASLYVYSAASYPVSQLVAASAMVAATALLASVARRGDSRGRVRAAFEAAPAVVVVVLAYPHMALLAPPVVGAAVLGSLWGAEWRARLVRVLSVAGGALLVCVVCLPERVAHAVDYARFLSKAGDAGYPLPLIDPLGLLGFQGEFSASNTQSAAVVALEVLVVAAVLFAAITLHRRVGRARAVLAATAVAVVLVTYGVVYIARGESYTAWKWAAFFVPLLVVGFLACIVLILRRVVPDRARVMVSVGLLAMLVALQGAAAYGATDELDPYNNTVDRRGWGVVTEPISTMGDGPAWRGVTSVTVELRNAWEAFWSRYFVPVDRITMAGILAALEPPRDGWVLEDRQYVQPHPPGTEFRPINDLFVLVRESNEGVKPGTLWEVGNCAGLYRFDGRRWQAVERTRNTGAWAFRATFGSRPAGTRAKLLVRHIATLGNRRLATLAVEYLDDNRARFVVDSAAADARAKKGRAFDLQTGAPMSIEVIFDPLTSEVSARVDGREVLDTELRFLRPRFGHIRGDGITFSAPVNQFPGTIEIEPSSHPLCDAAHRSGILR